MRYRPRFEEALDYFPNIKALGLSVSDYNCTWYVDAVRLEKKLQKIKELYPVFDDIENHANDLGTPCDMFHPEYGWLIKEGETTEAGIKYFKDQKQKALEKK